MRKLFTVMSENETLVYEYSRVHYDSSSMQAFLSSVFSLIKNKIGFPPEESFLDIGCGRGYLLRFLSEKGYKNILGVEPCEDLVKQKVFDNIISGSFETNNLKNDEYDNVFICHTLHHLKDKNPKYAIKEMLRIAKKHIIIIEINNTNLPLLFFSMLNFRIEANAMLYSKSKVEKLLTDLNCEIVYSGNLKSEYVSGNSWFYKFLAHFGSRPYNIIIAKKK